MINHKFSLERRTSELLYRFVTATMLGVSAATPSTTKQASMLGATSGSEQANAEYLEGKPELEELLTVGSPILATTEIRKSKHSQNCDVSLCASPPKNLPVLQAGQLIVVLIHQGKQLRLRGRAVDVDHVCADGTTRLDA